MTSVVKWNNALSDPLTTETINQHHASLKHDVYQLKYVSDNDNKHDADKLFEKVATPGSDGLINSIGMFYITMMPMVLVIFCER